jgi:transposase InsO family protein
VNLTPFSDKKKSQHLLERKGILWASLNLVNQEFTVTGPNKVWVSDMTYVWTLEGWLYLTTVKDLWSRRVIAYAITDHLRAEAVVEALEMALRHRQIDPGLIFHSDRGTQYASQVVRSILTSNGIRQSMSSTGNCYDNAPAESFFASFKKGHPFWQPSHSKEEARRRIIEYLEIFTTA